MNALPSSRTTSPQTTFRVALFSLMIVEIFSGVLQVYFVPIYSQLANQFHVTIVTLTLALTAFQLATVVATPLFAKLGDVYGHLRILKIEVGVVALGSIMIAIAPVFWVLVVGRVLQGAFAAYLPLMFGLIRDRYDHDKTRRAVSYLSGILFFGVILGLISVSFLLKASSSIAPVLWVPAVGTLVGLGLLFAIRRTSAERTLQEARPHIDWAGMACLAMGLLCILAGLTYGSRWGWGSILTIGIFIVGVVLLALWVLIALRVEHPLVDVRFLFQPHLIPVYAIGFVIYFGAIGTQVATSTFMALPESHLGYGLGLTPTQIGLWLLPGYFVSFVAILFTARLGRAIGFRWAMFLGAAAFVIGFGGLVFAHSNLAVFLVFSWITALGVGFIEPSTRTIVIDVLREGEVAIGEGIYELAITVGGSVGSAVVAAMIASNSFVTSGVSVPKMAAFIGIWGTCAILGLIVAVIAFLFALRKHVTPPLDATPA